MVLAWVPPHVAEVGVQVVHPDGYHPVLEPAPDGGRLVVAKVDAAAILNLLEEGAELLIPGFGGDNLGAREQIVQDGGDILQIGDDVHGGRGQGARHRVVLGSVRVLNDDCAPGRLDIPRASGAVGAQSGEDDGKETLAENRRRRGQEQIDGRLRTTRFLKQRDAVVVDFHMAVCRDDEDDTRLQRYLIRDDPNRQCAARAEDLREMADTLGVEVLRDQDRGGEVGRKRPDQRRQRINPTRRRPNHDELADVLLGSQGRDPFETTSRERSLTASGGPTVRVSYDTTDASTIESPPHREATWFRSRLIPRHAACRGYFHGLSRPA